MIFIKALTDRNFDKNIRRARCAAVLFFANSCAPCRMTGESFRAVSERRKGTKFFTVNVDDEEHLAKRCGVEILPAILFFCDGELLLARYGITGKKSLENTLDGLKNN